MKIKFAVLVATGMFMALGGTAVAQKTQRQPQQTIQMQQPRSGMSSLTSSEKQFLTKSAQDSLYEFVSAELAVQRAQSDNVAQYAQRIMDDHSEYNKQLMQLARQEKLTLPVELDSQQKSKLSRLMQLHGNAFDREYTNETAKANAEDVADLQRESNTAKSPAVQAFISQFLPVQQQHLQLATALKNNSSNTSNRSQMMGQ